VLGVVVYEHVVRQRQERPVHRLGRRDGHLETTHVARVARVLQAVLVALHEEFEEEPATQKIKIYLSGSVTEKVHITVPGILP
jgi:hypothetical protein